MWCDAKLVNSVDTPQERNLSKNDCIRRSPSNLLLAMSSSLEEDRVQHGNEEVKDPLLESIFQKPSFDPVVLLNGLFPTPSFVSNQPPVRTTPIQDALSQLQALLSKLNTHNYRYADALTQSTDNILRSGSRLAYEVEILGRDADGLHDLLTETLHSDVQLLRLQVPEVGNPEILDGRREKTGVDQTGGHDVMEVPPALQVREFIMQLRTLEQVKARLEDVITVLGKSMKWPLPPSEHSITSSLKSVSAPAPGSEKYIYAEKDRDMAGKLRQEIAELLDSKVEIDRGIKAASDRVDQLRLLVGVWKGTAEERARAKFVDDLEKMIEDRRKILNARSEIQQLRTERQSLHHASSLPERMTTVHDSTERNSIESGNPAGGLLRNLQRLRDEIYLD